MTEETGNDPESGVLTPEELDVGRDERVTELDDDRYFVSTGDGRADASDDVSGDVSGASPGDPPTEPTAGPEGVNPDRVLAETPDVDSGPESPPDEPARTGSTGRPDADALESALADVEGQFAVAAAVRTDAGVTDHRFGSNNVAETFEALVRWYADRAGDGRTPTDEVVRILLAESDLEP